MNDDVSGKRPGWDDYFMGIARHAARRSNCIRRRVGAIIVKGRAIVSTGYNGTPMGVTNCYDGGCPRCAANTPPGEGYDTCLCVHAEQNAIVLAARHGTSVEGGVLYSTLRPCFGCVKEVIQAGIKEVVFGEDWPYPEALEASYGRIVNESGVKLRLWRGNRAEDDKTSEH